MVTETALNTEQLLSGGGEIGKLILATDWSQSSLGPIEDWPHSLRYALSICLNSGFPMAIYWGPDYNLLYNCAWSSIPGDKHPWALGKPGNVVWPEIWDEIETQFQSVLLKGKSYRSDNSLLCINRYGYQEECYFDYTLSPIWQPDGTIGGVFNAVMETTYRVISERRNRIAHDLIKYGSQLRSVEEGYKTIGFLLEKEKEDIPFCLIYALDKKPVLKVATGMAMEDVPDIGWPFIDAISSGNPKHIRGLSRYMKNFRGTRWPEPCCEALIVPIISLSTTRGFMVVGINPRKRLDADYQDFLEAIAIHIGSAIANAKMHEDEHRNRLLIAESEERLKTAIESSYLGIWDYNPVTGRFISSSQMNLLLGFSQDDELTLDMAMAIVCESDRERVEQALERTLSPGSDGNYDVEYQVTHQQDGSVRWIKAKGQAFFDNEGKATRIIGTVIDTTQNRKAEVALKEQEAIFRNMSNHVPMIIWTTDTRGKCTFVNKQWTDFTGQSFEDAVNNGWGQIVHPDDAQRLKGTFISAIQYHLPISLDYRVLRRDGEYRWVTDTATPRFDENGKFMGHIGSMVDITERKSHEEALNMSLMRFRLLADSMPQKVWTADARGKLNYFNETVYGFTGLDFDQMKGDGWTQALHPDEREDNIRYWKQCVRTGQDFILENRFRRHDGEYIWQLSRAVPQRDNNGDIQLWIGTSTDIQDQKLFAQQMEQKVHERTRELEMANRELERANKELASFAYVSSHDLQEPLRKIQAFSSRIIKKESEHLSETGRDYLVRVDHAAQRMQKLIEDLLTYSRTTTSQRVFTHTSLNDILKVAMADLEQTIREKSAAINHDELPVLNVIPFQMEQLFTNLLSNALKFSKRDVAPTVNISFDRVDGSSLHHAKADLHKSYYRIVFRDNGIGFEQGYAQRIFEVFQRLHGRSEYSGTGIGLAICKRITENHNGFITATGEPGIGAAFSVYLPVS